MAEKHEESSKAGGKMEEMKGRAKSTIGEASDNPEMTLEGKREEERCVGEQRRAELEKEGRETKRDRV